MARLNVPSGPIKEGEIPIGWKALSLGEVLVESQYGTNAPSTENGDVPIVGMKDVNDGRIRTDDLAFTTLDDGELRKFLLASGDLLLNRTNSHDLVGKIGIYESSVPAVFASYLVRLRANTDIIKPYYLNYWLNSESVQKTIKRIATRAIGQANINPSEFKKHCRVLVPPIHEQESITEFLGSIDEALDKTRRLVEAKGTRKYALAQQLLFGKSHLRGHKGKWNDATLKELTRELKNRNNHLLGSEAVMAVNKFQGLIPMREHIMASSLERYKVVPPKAFAYNPMRINIGSLAMSHHSSNVLVSPDYVVFKCIEDRCDPEFLDHYRRTHAWEQYVNAVGNGSVRVRIYYSELSRMKLRLPPIEEQRAISAVLNDADREIELTKLKLAALQKQKRGLMQKLLTGEWRMKVTNQDGK